MLFICNICFPSNLLINSLDVNFVKIILFLNIFNWHLCLHNVAIAGEDAVAAVTGCCDSADAGDVALDRIHAIIESSWH